MEFLCLLPIHLTSTHKLHQTIFIDQTTSKSISFKTPCWNKASRYIGLFAYICKHFRFEPPANISSQNGQCLFLWIIAVRAMKGIFVYVMFYLHTAAFFVWVDRSDNDDVRWVEWSVKLSHRVVSSLLKPSVQRWNLILQQTQLKSTDG